MTKFTLSVVLVAASIPLAAQQSHPIGGKTHPLAGQSYKDPNLKQQRIHADRSTASPEGHLGGGMKADQNLDKIERQTDHIMTQSAPKQKTVVPKFQPEPERHTNGFDQTMPVHAQGNGLKTTSGGGNHRSTQPARAASTGGYRH